jgi:hypothetical protein
MRLHATESCLLINLAHLHDRRAPLWHSQSCHPQYSSSPLTCTSCQRQRSFARSQLVPTSTPHSHSTTHRARLNVDVVERHRKLVVDTDVLLLPSRHHLLVAWLPPGCTILANFIQDYAVRSIRASASRLCIDCAHGRDIRAQEWYTVTCHQQPPLPFSPLHLMPT